MKANSSDEKQKAASAPPRHQSTNRNSEEVVTGDQSVDPDDRLFELSVDEMVNDFDDEQTLAEEEALVAASGEQDVADELNNLQKVRRVVYLVWE